MLRNNTVDVVYDVSNTEGEKNLFVTAGKDTRTGEYIVKIINLGNTPATFSLNLNGKKFTGRATSPHSAQIPTSARLPTTQMPSAPRKDANCL